jgi:hypothetical protein
MDGCAQGRLRQNSHILAAVLDGQDKGKRRDANQHE